MQKKQQYTLDSLHRVQAFLDVHAGVIGSLKQTEARKQLDGAVGRATAQENDRGTAERTLAGAGHEVRQLVGDLKAGHMTPVAQFARANLRGVPNFKALAHVPHNLRGASLVGAARAMATAALPYVDTLAKAEFPAESVQQLAEAADALKGALDGRMAARSQRVVATAGVRHELGLGRGSVAMLDPIVTKRLAGYPELFAGWRSAKRMTAMPQSSVVASIGVAPSVTNTPEVKAA